MSASNASLAQWGAWWKENKEMVHDHCENRMDKYDAEAWLKAAFKDGFDEGSKRVNNDLTRKYLAHEQF